MTREEAIQCIKHELLINVNRKDLIGQAIGEALDIAIEALEADRARIVFLCDGKACDGDCKDCKHTKDITHAKNFYRIEGRKWVELDQIKALQRETSTISEKHQLSSERHGEWEKDRLLTTKGGGYDVIRCSECKSQFPIEQTNYCPNCGAKMDGGKDEK